ncbi:MAG: carboxypeptidase regulatory-like domain-containing protein [Myxococcota bacterium]
MSPLRTVILLAAVLLTCAAALAGTTGRIRGVVVDAETLEPLADVAVVATSPALMGEQTSKTDALGRFMVTGLPPGTYTVRYVYGGATAERKGVLVASDRVATANADLSSAVMTAAIYTVDSTTPSVNATGNAVGAAVTGEFLRNIPFGRTRNFDNAIDLLPSGDRDAFGPSLGGATSPEIQFIIDGLNITDPAFGLSGARLVLDFIDEIDMVVGGYSAEYGRAIGGLVKVVTKSGGNETHGSVFVTYRPAYLAASQSQARGFGATITERQRLGYYLNPGFEVGGAILEDKLWFHVGYAPEVQSDRWGRGVYALREGGDADGNANPDGPLLDDAGALLRTRVDGTRHNSLVIAHQFTAKLTHRINDESRHSIGIRGAPTTFDGVRHNPFDPISPKVSLINNKETFAFEQLGGNLGGQYAYTGELLDGKMVVDAHLGWHHQESIYNPTRSNRDTPLIIYEGRQRLRDLQPDAPRPCEASFDFDDGTSRCSVVGYRVGDLGQGLVQTILLNRISERTSATHRFDFAGTHQLKVGLDFEQNLYYNRRWYNGLGFYRYEESGIFSGQQFFRPGREDVPAHHLTSRTGSANFAAYLQDSWSSSSVFTVNYGLRVEAQQLFSATAADRKNAFAEMKLSIYDNVAPRIGAVWDFLGSGRSRLFAHWGRFYESLPLDLADRALTGKGFRLATYDGTGDFSGAPCRDAAGNRLDATEVTDPRVQCQELSASPIGGDDAAVAPGLEGQYTDETLLGAEIELWPSWVFGLSGIHRRLGSAIETISPDGGNSFIIANPGRFDTGRLGELDAAMANAADADDQERLASQRLRAAAINAFPEPRRELWGLIVALDKKMVLSGSRFAVRASYMLSWTSGNHPGRITAHAGRLTPNGAWQLTSPELLLNRDGPLPNDRRHRFKVDGIYRKRLEDFGVHLPVTTTTGASLRLMSGTPIDVLGADSTYGPNQVFLLPRGEGGRTPWVWSADIHIGARYDFGDGLGAELFVDLFNVFNRQQPVRVDQTYTFDSVEPIVGGNEDDLVHARNVDGAPVRTNPAYKQPVLFQQPLSGQLGLRVSF